MVDKAIVVFSGFNQRAVIAFLRTLEGNEIPYGIIAHSSRDPIFKTAYNKNVMAVRECEQLELLDLLSKINIVQQRLAAKKYVIAPSSESINRLMLDNQEALSRKRCEVPLVDVEKYAMISDKYSFGDLCRYHGISVPFEYESISRAVFPFVAKPRRYTSDSGRVHNPFLIFDEEDKAVFLKEHLESDFYFQEYVEGDSYYLLYCFMKKGGVSKFSQVNLIQQPNGKSIIAAQDSSLHLSSESKKYEYLFSSIGFYGLVMVEVRRKDNAYYMIEANPRFWGPSQLFVDAGVNLFESLLYDNDVISAMRQAEVRQNVKYLWLGGLVQSSSMGDVKVFDSHGDGFLKDFAKWLKFDVYNRSDTHEIFYQELGIG
ncbi:hypothetical protein [Halomonas nitroreducens]|uniref:ATP-grasp domain-containing protein n=1 Tax=Halomonas nitroreducens TaxID=447425 RepID=A0A3S0K4H8_9GAMM|nr:hypothetical protein [Halomonas nitroreducens]RTR05356.1 hypothetical protein EKG36_07160 [Halomonas nitroreducens]